MREELLHFKYLHSAMRFALPHRNAIIVILLLTVLMAGANAAEPLVLKYIFDDLAEQAAANSTTCRYGCNGARVSGPS
jgi:hypothetical protein